jgi:hypothetical protein
VEVKIAEIRVLGLDWHCGPRVGMPWGRAIWAEGGTLAAQTTPKLAASWGLRKVTPCHSLCASPGPILPHGNWKKR